MKEVLTVESKYLDRDDNGYLYYANKPFTGKAVWYSSDGRLTAEAYYVDGVQDGWMRGWYKNGQLRSETFYDKGCVVNVYKKWYENGQLKLEAKAGRLENEWKKEWDENGNLITNYKSIVAGK